MHKKLIRGVALLAALVAFGAGPALAHASEPHWYSEGVQIAEGEQVNVTTHGTLTFSFVVSAESEVTCTVNDQETIENPIGGGAGVDKFTSLTFSSCFIPTGGSHFNAQVCGSGTPEVIALNLGGWSTHLTTGLHDEITGVDLELKCSTGAVLETLTGTLSPLVGASVLTFNTSTGTLNQSSPYTGTITHVIGTDTLIGPKGDKKITTHVNEQHWYSNGALIPEGKKENVETHGTLTFSHVVSGESEVTCTVNDQETIENPVGGGAGVDSFTSLTFSSCFIPAGGNAPVCGSGTPELIALNLGGWSTHLVAGPRDEITGVDIELKCSTGAVLETLTGSLRPLLENSVLTFNTNTGTLNQGSPYTGTITHVIGTDTMTGPIGDEIITSQEFPGLGRCVKVATGTGHYLTATCEGEEVKSLKSSYEWFGGAVKPKFTSSEGASFFETKVGKSKITCVGSTDTGEYIGESLDFETIRFTGCETSGIACTSAGAASGEIRTSLLRSLYGFIKGPKTVGVSLEPASGTTWAEFTCGPVGVVIKGSVIAQVTPISKMVLEFKEKFSQAAGKQNPEKFEFQPKDVLEVSFNGGPVEQLGFSSSEDKIVNEEKLELREI